jgi:hypothetical protein
MMRQGQLEWPMQSSPRLAAGSFTIARKLLLSELINSVYFPLT